jgi:hypothetical protein
MPRKKKEIEEKLAKDESDSDTDSHSDTDSDSDHDETSMVKTKVALGVGIGIAALIGAEELLEHVDDGGGGKEAEEAAKTATGTVGDVHHYSELDDTKVHSIIEKDDYNVLVFFGKTPCNSCDGVLPEWDRLVAGWKYDDDIHPFHIDKFSHFGEQIWNSDLKTPEMAGTPTIMLKYDGNINELPWLPTMDDFHNGVEEIATKEKMEELIDAHIS